VNLARHTVKRPVFTTMAALIVLIVGAIALRRLPIDLMPDISYPSLSIFVAYANADPQVVEQLITKPIEEAMAAVPGVEEINSTSSEGSSSVRLAFAWGTDLEAASNDVRDRLDRVIGRLPDEAERPRLFKFDAASFPIMALGIVGDIDPVYLRQIVDDQFSYRLERVPGVASAEVWGGFGRQVQINLIPERLKSLDIAVDQILSRVTAANVQSPVGTLYEGRTQRTLRTSALHGSLQQVADTVVSVRQGVPVTLGQVAEIRDSFERPSRIARINGKPGIRLSISKQSGKNTVEVAKAVRQELDQLGRDFPQIQITVLNDSSTYIERSIGNVGTSAIFGGLIALAVLLLFLRSVRSSLIIGTSIPLSIIATFALMYFNGFTLNIMSLGALALGVGMLVDNSIVVLENTYRLRESGQGAIEGAIQGADEVGSAVLASTLTTVIVFLPLIFIRGISGVMYKQLALVVSFALLCSLVSALTLVPMLSAKLLKQPHADPSGNGRSRLSKWAGSFHDKLDRFYGRMLAAALGRPAVTLITVLVLLAGSALLATRVGSELMPRTDEGQVRIDGSMEVGTRLEITDAAFKNIERIVQDAVPEAQTMLTSVGGGGRGGSASGQISLTLKPRARRGRSDEQIAADLRRKLAGIPGITLRTRTGQGFFFLRMGGGGTERVQIEVRGYDLAAAAGVAARIQKIAEQVPGVTDAQLSREGGAPEDWVTVDRLRTAELNLTVKQVSALLQTLVSGTGVGTLRQGEKEIDLVVRLKDAEQVGLDRLLELPVTYVDGRPVALRNVVNLHRGSGPVAIERNNQERRISINANTSGRDPNAVVEELQQRLRSLPLAEGLSVRFSGDYEEQKRSSRELALAIALSLVLVYMVMACLYESLRDPFIVMFSVPLSLIGLVLMLFLTRTTFNIQSGIGALMLGGIVVNNAILLVDTANLLRRRDGMSLREAVEQAARRRLRPILMTSLTTILGLLPMAIGFGEGGEVQAPLARAVIGGLSSATFITLLIIPTVYLVIEGRREKKEGRRAATEPVAEGRTASR